MTSDAVRVEVFQPRDNPVKRFTADDHEDMEFEDFGEEYRLVGTDTVTADSEEEAVNKIWELWNNGGDQISNAFRSANTAERAVSLSVGHVVRVNGAAYLIASAGQEKINHLSY